MISPAVTARYHDDLGVESVITLKVANGLSLRTVSGNGDDR